MKRKNLLTLFCIIKKCDRAAYAKGLCRMHTNRLKATGSLVPTIASIRTLKAMKAKSKDGRASCIHRMY